MAETKNISLDSDAQEMWSRNEQFIEKQYGGASGLFKAKLSEIDQSSDLEIERQRKEKRLSGLKQEVNNLVEEISRLDRQIEKKEKEEELEKKRDKLEELEREKEELQEKPLKEEEIREKVEAERESRGQDIEKSSIQGSIQEQVERILERRTERIEEIDEEIETLKSEIGELEVEAGV
ncbi:MAG: hypothetical protein ABEK00_00580 [Candidatus Nanohaloarchaea archaeon]